MTMVVFLPFRPTRPPRPCLVSPKTSLPLPLASLVFRDYLSLPIGHYHLDRRRRGTPATRNVGCKTETSGIGPSFPTRTFITTHLGSLTSPRHAAAAGPWPARWLDLRRWRRGIARARGREASSGSQPPQVTYGSAAAHNSASSSSSSSLAAAPFYTYPRGRGGRARAAVAATCFRSRPTIRLA